MSQGGSRPAAAILSAGLLAGLLDITAAFVTWVPRGVSAARILRGIASGMLGSSAIQGGTATALLGLGLHFVIALGAATIFYAASRAFGFLVARPIVSGCIYGVLVYFVMYWIVLPLSRYHKRPFSLSEALIAVLTHIFCVGVPIALVIRRIETRPL